MDITKLLRKEESKLEHQLHAVQAALGALNGGTGRAAVRRGPPKGRHLSAAHRAAIKAAWAKRRKMKAA